MLPRTAQADPFTEIACDESGYEGENLAGGNTDVFAHAGVVVTTALAARTVRELRHRIRSPAEEYKANHLLREKHRPVLEWLLGPAGPLLGNARVHLTDKAYSAVGRVTDLLLGAEPGLTAGGAEHAGHVGGADPRPDPAARARLRAAVAAAGPGRDPRARGAAVLLRREGPRALGDEGWRAFVAAGNELMRTRCRTEEADPVAAFFDLLDALRRTTGAASGSGAGRGSVADAVAAVRPVLERLARGRPYAEAYRAGLPARPDDGMPVLDPLFPALLRTVEQWHADGGGAVRVVHDRQNQLTPERVALLREFPRTAAGPGDAAAAGYGGARPAFAELLLVRAGTDARVQLADFLAGTARKIASEELNGRGDARLSALLRPYVAPSSCWAAPAPFWPVRAASTTGSPGVPPAGPECMRFVCPPP